MTSKRILALSVAPLAILSGCKAGPDYVRPMAPMTTTFKEVEGWTPASPKEAAGWESWWAIYEDPVLDGLEKQVDVSNQNLKVAEAAYRAARGEVGVQRGQLLPLVTASSSARLTGGGSRNAVSVGTGGGGGPTVNTASGRTLYQLSLGATWDADLWGRIRRTVESSVATAQASAADIAGARLSAQSELAIDYFQLRAADQQTELLNEIIMDFQQALMIAQNRYRAGIATLADVYAAQTQVDNVEAQLVNIKLTRARMEHAIATLTGRPPSEVSIVLAPLATNVPVVPAGVPSSLLERRPDITAAEYNVASANAQIGVAEAAWFPDLTLAGSYGLAGNSLGRLLNVSNAVWSVGPSLAQTIFNGGARKAQTEEARARYDQTVATYRETVLTAFQQVEDQLATLKVLEEEAAVQERTVADARQSEQLALNQYRAGTADFTSVITAQTTRFNAENAALATVDQRLAGSVGLVVALGGGWDASRVPQPGRFYGLPEAVDEVGPMPQPKS